MYEKFQTILFREIRWQAEMVRFWLKQLNLAEKEDREKGEKIMNRKLFYTAVIILSFLALGIQPAFAVINVPGDETYYVQSGNTYTLNQDIFGQITITSNEITLDGGGFKIKPSATEFTYGIFVINKNYVTIQNVIIQKNEALPPLEQKFDTGIAIQQCSNISLTGNNVSDCDRGSLSAGIDLSYTFLSELNSNDVSYNSIGIRLANSFKDGVPR